MLKFNIWSLIILSNCSVWNTLSWWNICMSSKWSCSQWMHCCACYRTKVKHSFWRNKFVMNTCVHIKKEIMIIFKIITENVLYHIADFFICCWVILEQPFLKSNCFYQKIKFFQPKSCWMCRFLFSNFLLVIVILNTILLQIPFMFRSLFKFNIIVTALKFISSDIYHPFFDSYCSPC
jgi:hypothetical protein